MNAEESAQRCKRPYDVGKRQENSDRTREAVLAAARTQLESGGMRELTMESLAKASGVTRQTIHNLFGTRRAILEALFDRLALNAGMQRMREVMTEPDPEAMLRGLVAVFADFWTRDRLLLKRVHGIAAIDPEFGQAIEARNQRRHMAAVRVVDRLGAGPAPWSEQQKSRARALLVALTSFEFFDALAESAGSAEAAAALLYPLVKRALAPVAEVE